MINYKFDPTKMYLKADFENYICYYTSLYLNIKPNIHIGYDIKNTIVPNDLYFGNVLDSLSQLAKLAPIKTELNLLPSYTFSNIKTINKINSSNSNDFYYLKQLILSKLIIPIDMEDDTLMLCSSSGLFIFAENYNLKCRHQIKLYLADSDYYSDDYGEFFKIKI